MKKIFFLLASIVTLFFTAANAQTPASANSLLWKISGNGLVAPSYLAGTFHMMCAKDFLIKDKIKSALNSVDRLVLEVNFSDQAEVTALQKLMQSEKTISSQLTAEKAKALDSVLRSYGTTLKDVDVFSPAALYSLLGQKAVSCPMTEIKLYEFELMRMAARSGKKISGLEKVSEQQGFVEKSYSLDQLIEVLGKGDEYIELSKGMTNAFRNEDLPSLDRYVKDRKFMSEEQEILMLTKRNHNWVKLMPAIMKEGSTMFAVGGGHLWGNDGVITLLRKDGYTVEPIMQ